MSNSICIRWCSHILAFLAVAGAWIRPLKPNRLPNLHGRRINRDITTMSVEAFGDQILSALRSSLHPSALHEHPGFSMGLGTNKWRSGGYRGSVRGFSGGDVIHWLGVSEIEPDAEVERDERGTQTRLDILLQTHSSVNLPHLRISVKQLGQLLEVSCDLVPRVDLIDNEAYFDAFYSHNATSAIHTLLSRENDINIDYRGFDRIRAPDGLRQLFSSPSKVLVFTESTEESLQICMRYLECWTSWASIKSILQNSHEFTISKERDRKLQEVLFEDMKLQLAFLFDSRFAPKALDIAASFIGPQLH